MRRRFLTRLRRPRQRPIVFFLLFFFFFFLFVFRLADFVESRPSGSPSTLPMVRAGIEDLLPQLTAAAAADFEPFSSRLWRLSLSALIILSSSKNTYKLQTTGLVHAVQ